MHAIVLWTIGKRYFSSFFCHSLGHKSLPAAPKKNAFRAGRMGQY
jgi:hypothetical protein